MERPVLTIVPQRSGFVNETTRTLDLVATLTVPKPTDLGVRTPVSLALVLDRSGSMQGDKMAFARAGASAAISQLAEDDRVSLTIFDDQVEVLQPLLPSQRAADLHAKIALIEARANTDLLGGWSAGAATLGGTAEASRPRRIILLTDGQANHGVTDSGAIAAAIAEAARRGIATSAMGIGEDYNEDLLEAISRSGDGSYYYVEEADQLPGLFEAELRGFKAVVGRDVTVAILPASGVEVVDVYNDFPRSSSGSPVLPNLVAGARQSIGFSVRSLASQLLGVGQEAEVCVVQITWTDPESGARNEVRSSVRLPVTDAPAFDALPPEATVSEALALLKSARAKRAALKSLDASDEAGIRSALRVARTALEGLASTPSLEKEAASLDSLEKDLIEGRLARLRKNAHYESYSRSHSVDDGRFEVHINRKMIMLASRKIDVVRGDLAQFPAGALVNSRSEGPGLDEHLRSVGGPQFRSECERLGALPVGTVRATSGGKLASPLVLHAVVPDWTGAPAEDAAFLAAVYRDCFQVARDRGVNHFAFPLLGAGARGFPLKIAVEVAIVAVATILFRDGLKQKVSFVCRDERVARALESMLEFGSVGS